MLIYNYKKEFIGIDEKVLKVLKLENLAQLRAEAADFADLFVKTPGYIHNFQHVHWIDYITCADSTEQPKVIINVNGGLFKAVVVISTAYLAENPLEKAYIVTLNHLRALTDSEKSSISTDLLDRPLQQPTTQAAPVNFKVQHTAKPSIVASEVIEDEYDNIEKTSNTLDVDELNIDDVIDDSFDMYPELAATNDAPLDLPESIEIPESIDIPDSIEFQESAPEQTQSPIQASKPLATPATNEDLEKVFHSTYVYNPQIASDKLGLPLDLIEEFIEDFINQAKEFKPNLYSALDEGDIDNVKILSHKLKGVAANLRIEDALEVLTTINTSSDLNIIKKNLDLFYLIIAKLAGEEASLSEVVEPIAQPAEELEEEDELLLDFKDEIADEISIVDEDVPEQIDLPELADDNFVVPENFDIDLTEEPLSFDNDENLEIEVPKQSIKTSYSKELLANEIGLDVASIHDLLEEFLTEAKEIVEEMKLSLQNNDLNSLKTQARQLQGMSNNIRFNDLSNELQNIVYTEQNEAASEVVNKIETLLNQISIED